MSAQHTPGPWDWDVVLSNSIDIKANKYRTRIATLTHDTNSDDDAVTPQMIVDAALIAAAPDLLAACKDALHLVNPEYFPYLADRLRAAIAKAEGA